MRIKSLKIKNFCQHTDRDDTFCGGVTGIVGANGSGKSNYLNALRFALTGFNSSQGKKEDDMRWGCDDGHVALNFEVGNQTGHIKRQLKTSRCELTFGRDKITTASEIDDIIYKIIGVPARVLTDMVFVRQGQLEGILFQKPSERAKSFQALFGTDNAHVLRDLLQESTHGLTLTSNKDHIMSLEAEYEALTKKIAETNIQLREVSENIVAPEAIAVLEKQVLAYELYKASQSSFLQTEEELAGVMKEIRETNGQLSSMITASQSLTSAIEGMEKEAEYANSVVRDYKHYKSLQPYLEAAKASRIKDLEWLSQPAPEHMDSPQKELEELERQIRIEETALAYSTKALATQAGETCPSCLQVVSSGHLDHHRYQIQVLSKALAPLKEKHYELRDRYIKWEQNYRNYHAQLPLIQERLSKAEATLSAPVTAISEQLYESAVSTVTAYEEAKKSAMLSELNKSMMQAALLKLRKHEVFLRENLKSFKSAGEAELISEGRYEAIALTLRVSRDSQILAGNLQGLLGHATHTRTLVEEKLKNLREQEQRLEPSRRWCHLVERARSLLHHDCLPQAVAQVYTRSLNGKLAQYLELFGVPFLARIEPDLSIIVNFDGREVPGYRLSGGQKVMLSIAFRFAVHDIFASNLQLLVMDEPTVWLDVDRIDAVFELLMKVKSHSVSSGLQVIIVTHEPRLMGAFDQTIKL